MQAGDGNSDLLLECQGMTINALISSLFTIRYLPKMKMNVEKIGRSVVSNEKVLHCKDNWSTHEDRKLIENTPWVAMQIEPDYNLR